MTLSRLPAPFPPLVSGGEGLEQYPAPPMNLVRRMAELYGVSTDQVLPVRGVTHGIELVYRLASRDGGRVEAPEAEPYRGLASLYPDPGETADILAVVTPSLGDTSEVANLAARAAPALVIVDEGFIEFAGASAASAIPRSPNLIILRSLSLSHGLAGARIGAALGQASALSRLASVLEPYAIPEPSVRLALQALDPSRMIETAERTATVRRERDRMVEALRPRMSAEPGAGPVVDICPTDPEASLAALGQFGVDAVRVDGRLRLPVSARVEINDRALVALGAALPAGRPSRTGQAVRDTKETQIVCAVDLDAPGPVRIQTGIGFFDHMLEQVAAHGGFSLRLSCEGDLHTDPHHTVEDSAIAFGQALKQALGERRGIARYGFVLPMDEALAQISIDLSGRPCAVFQGAFATPFIGDYRTDLTAHVFRSLAEHLGAAIHVSVTGDDDHHKTEACYKALGRALRQAIRVEDEAIPSTKGVL